MNAVHFNFEEGETSADLLVEGYLAIILVAPPCER